MRDEFLISEIKKNLDYLPTRGMAATAAAIEMLIKRFETLKTAHMLLAAREEKLTQEKISLTDRLESAENWIKRHENGVSVG